jgi:hypothetical protein
MATTEICPYCGQPLGSDEAASHLQKAEEKFRRQLLAEAKAETKAKIAATRKTTERKVRAELEREKSKRERGLEGELRKLQTQNSDLERRLEGLNAPERGDMNEADIAEELVHAFPEDDIQREGKGGDILQTVRYHSGGKLEEAGLILYECKDTKRWSNAFIEQIKADGQTHQTPYLLLVSQTLPAKEEYACVRDDVVIVDPFHVRHLAWIVRRAAIETHRAERAGQDRAGKTARLYEYLRSDEFRGQLSSLVGIGAKLSEKLQAERKSHERDWSRRQHTYDELVRNSVAIEEEIQRILESDAPLKHRETPKRRTRPRTRQHNGRTPARS